MTDVPADPGGAGPEPVAPSDPPVIRRSTYSAPPAGVEPPSFDDDALAEAMAEEVRPYTQPITLPRAPVTLPPPEAAIETPLVEAPPAPEPQLEPELPVVPRPEPEPPVAAPPAESWDGVPAVGATEEELLRSLGGASTLEAIERLENELRLLSQGESPSIDLTPTQEAAPVFDAPAPAPAETDPEPAPADTDPEPALDHPAPGHFFPAAFEPIAPFTPPDGEPLAPGPLDATDHTDVPAGPTAPPLPEVDESLIDPAAAAELNSGSAESASPRWPASEPADLAWDITAPPSTTEPPSAEPVEPPEPPAEPPVELVAPTEPPPEAVALTEPPAEPVAPPGSPAEPVARPPATPVNPFMVDPVVSAATPVPFSTEPPVGPEAPDWLEAPPPSYEPPELIEPPAFPDTASDPEENPLTAEALAQLPKPLPTEQPKLEDRAELPPPPGYENIPIMWGDVAAAPPPVAPNLIFPPSPAPTPFLDHDDDVIDEIDRVTGTGAIPVSSAGTAEPLAPPSEPIATIRLGEDEPALVDEKPQQPSAFEVESAGPEPTALDMRAGRAARLFWLWFAANSSVLSLGLGAVLLGTGMSLRQAIVAALAGVAISFLPLGLGTLAGKWSGQPTMIVSRATFGHAGNILPALLAVVTRVLWGGVLLWLLATAVAQVLVGAGLDAGLGTTVWQLVGLVAGFVIATLIAVFGYGFVAKLQLVLSILSALLIVGAGALTYQHLNFSKALTVPDGSWILVISGAAFVFSVVGLAWVHSSSDLARYQRPASYGGSSMLWATFGATLPPFALITWGAMLAASDPALAKGLTSNPLAAIASLLPAWYPGPLLAAAGIGLLSGAVLTMYSGGFAIQALGVRARRGFATFVSAILVLATAGALIFVVTDFGSLLRDLVVTIAVPVAAWAGIFAAEMMIRTRRFHAASLLAPGGLYPQVRWLNFLALIVISGIGFGLVTSGIPGLGWEGFLYGPLGIGPHDVLASSDAGVFVALLLGILVPLIGGVPGIRKQERSAIPR